jgi:hypothetical protein
MIRKVPRFQGSKVPGPAPSEVEGFQGSKVREPVSPKRRPGFLAVAKTGALALLITPVVLPAQSPHILVDSRMHHLRSGDMREWASFPAEAEGTSLTRPFEARATSTEWTLRLRHRDVKQAWRVVINTTEIARLPPDEVDMTTYWPVPPGVLKDGANELRILGVAGAASDDVMVGEIALLSRPRAAALTDGIVTVAVADEASGRAMPSRITVADERGSLVSTGNVSDAQMAVRPGVIYASTGQVAIRLPAGRYVIYAGRGFEYGVASTKVTLAAGSTLSRRLVVRREVDTAGWAAMDTHVHTVTYAKHGDATIEEQMHAIAGEGIELPVSTEHNVRIDFEEPARAAGVRAWFTPIVGSEVTTSAGHFNVWPLPATGPAIDSRAADWATLHRSITAAATALIIILNHGRDLHSNYRPLDPAKHVSLTGERLDGQVLPVNAMEVVNSGAVQSEALTLVEDWMGLLNAGHHVVAVGSSDSHDVARHFVGQARTYVRAGDADPGRIDRAEVAAAVARGQVLVSYGLLAEARVGEAGPGDLAWVDGDLRVGVRVLGPSWVRAERVAVYTNGVLAKTERIDGGHRAGLKWGGEVRLPRPRGDVHVVAVAVGSGITAPYWPTAKPYQPTSIEFTPYVLGVSGAVFVDVDGNGRFDSARSQAERLMAGDPDPAALARRLAGHDRAVAAQVASLLRVRDPAGFREALSRLLAASSSEAAAGLRAYVTTLAAH